MSTALISILFSEIKNAAGNGINPYEHPAEEFELYSVPAHETGKPEIVMGADIGSNKQVVSEGMVLLSKINPRINRVWVVKPASGRRQIASTEWIAFENNAYIKPEYLAHFLRQTSVRDFLAANASGVGGSLMRVKPSTLASYEFKLTGPRTQTRIVAKLEELLSELDAGVAELKSAQKKLQQYRQSLLKAAVEGALTADWRAKSTPAETGAQLLARILRERRARWEEKQLAKFRGQGKTPPKDWQSKYPEPVEPDTTGLPELPEGWVWASLDQLLFQLRSGSAETSSRERTDFPVLKSSAVRPGAIDYAALNYLSAAQSRAENWIEAGDLLISRLSGSVEYVGCCAQVAADRTQRVQYPDRLFCGKLVSHMSLLGSHIVICMSSSRARLRIEQAAKSTAGHKRISLSDLHPFPIPLAPVAEIQEVVSLIESALDQISRQEAAIAVASQQSTTQRQNILRAAFAGELVPQDPNDEPASVLLERIRAERAAAATTRKPRGRNAKESAR